MLNFRMVSSNNDLHIVAKLANEIWHEHYINIVSREQIQYMVDNFQSAHIVKSQIANEGYTYFIISVDDIDIGYYGVCERGDNNDKHLFLSKIYIRNTERGKRYGYKSFCEIVNFAKKNNLNSIRLTVNKKNDIALNAYSSWGMNKIAAVEANIGNGYIMDDYVMEYIIIDPTTLS